MTCEDSSDRGGHGHAVVNRQDSFWWQLTALAVAAVAMAAVTATIIDQRTLIRKNQQTSDLRNQDAELQALRKKNADLEATVERLETRVRDYEWQLWTAKDVAEKLGSENKALKSGPLAAQDQDRKLVEAIRYVQNRLRKLGHDTAIYGLPGTVRKIHWQAKRGDPLSQAIWGFLNLGGSKPAGIEQNIQEGLTWLNKAADQGPPVMRTAVGLLFLSGHRGKELGPGPASGLQMVTKAAHEGEVVSQALLGLAMVLGPKELGLPRNPEQGHAFLEAVSKQGYPFIYSGLGMLYSLGLPETNVSADNGKAMEWFLKGAAAGDLTSQVSLAVRYYEGEGTPRDLDAAFTWFRKASEQGDELSQNNLAHMYHKGEGVPRDLDQALLWYKKSAEQGFPQAQYALGLMYLEGEGVAADRIEAIKWLTEGAAQGHPEAKEKLKEPRLR
jgi:TPR repeat protein